MSSMIGKTMDLGITLSWLLSLRLEDESVQEIQKLNAITRGATSNILLVNSFTMNPFLIAISMCFVTVLSMGLGNSRGRESALS